MGAAVDDMRQRQCIAAPPFTLAQLKAAIPARCFVRSLPRSLAYLAVDAGTALLLAWSADRLAGVQHVAPVARAVLWCTYWLLQGCAGTGLWVIAHECGHRAFADSAVLCDLIGWAIHSALLVPYFAWRISHAKHHRCTADVDRDEAFVPVLRFEIADPSRTTAWYEDALRIAIMLLFGWPAYLLAHVRGRRYGRHVDHFDPRSPLFTDRDAVLVIAGDLGVVTMLGLLGWLVYVRGWAWVACIYAVPLAIVNLCLVLLTFLHHTDRSLPHFRGPVRADHAHGASVADRVRDKRNGPAQEWTWLRGALATVDRDYGPLNHIWHHIGDTHVVHHLFPYVNSALLLTSGR